MSRAQKTLWATTALCATTILGVHYLQQSERATMHEGVVRDEERARIRRARVEEMEVQDALRREFLKSQGVRDTAGGASDGTGNGGTADVGKVL